MPCQGTRKTNHTPPAPTPASVLNSPSVSASESVRRGASSPPQDLSFVSRLCPQEGVAWVVAPTTGDQALTIIPSYPEYALPATGWLPGWLVHRGLLEFCCLLSGRVSTKAADAILILDGFMRRIHSHRFSFASCLRPTWREEVVREGKRRREGSAPLPHPRIFLSIPRAPLEPPFLLPGVFVEPRMNTKRTGRPLAAKAAPVTPPRRAEARGLPMSGRSISLVTSSQSRHPKPPSSYGAGLP